MASLGDGEENADEIIKGFFVILGRQAFKLAVYGWLLLSASLWSFYSAAADSDVEAQRLKEPLSIFEPVLPGHTISVSSAFEQHPDYQNEVWNFKANVIDDEGIEYGIQWILYRISVSDNNGIAWQDSNIYNAQVVVNSGDKIWKQQRIARGGIGQAGVVPQPLRMWLDNWHWQGSTSTPFPANLVISSDDFSIALQTVTSGPYVIHGDKGYQVKHDLLPLAAYSISAPFLTTKGALELNAKKVNVQGRAWLDKEWGNQLFDNEDMGWESFSLQLDDGQILSVHRYHHGDDIIYLSGTLADKSGRVVHLAHNDIRFYPLEKVNIAYGKELSLRWVIEIPQQKISLITNPVEANMWLPFWVPAWQGPVNVTGSNTGHGFMHISQQ